MKIILQHDERDCGAACLAMVAGYYGFSQPLNVFRNLSDTDETGTSAYGIIKAAEKIGLFSEALAGTAADLLSSVRTKEFRLPFIAPVRTQDNLAHFVVVSEMDEEKVLLFDPAKGRTVTAAEDFFSSWAGSVITFFPTSAFKKRNYADSGLLKYFSLLKSETKQFALIIFLSLFISGIGIAGAFAFQLVIDHSSEMIHDESEAVHDHHEHEIEFLTESEWLNERLEKAFHSIGNLSSDNISLLFCCLIFLYMFAASIQYVRGRLIISLSERIDIGLTLPYFNRIMDLPSSDVRKRKTGDYLSRYSDISAIRNAVSTAVITIIIDSMMVFGCGIILFGQSRELFLIAGVLIIIYAVIVLGNSPRLKNSNRKFMEENAFVHSYMKESIDGIETIKSINASNRVKTVMASKFRNYMNAAVTRSRIEAAQDALVTGIETAGIAIILWRGFLLVSRGSMTLGTLITFYALLGYFITPIKNMIELLPVMESGAAAAERLSDIMEMPAEKSEGIDMDTIAPVDKWEVSDLQFRYGIGDPVLCGVSFSFRKGETTAVIGESGSGKTTLAKIFTRICIPESGNIFADGVGIDRFTPASLRRSVGLVSSGSAIFSGTILENLKMADPCCSEADFSRACDAAGIEKMTASLPGGLDYLVEENGANLSNGQKQRIAIARALLMNPKLLILDEATANLDTASEKVLLDSIKKSYPELAVILITHRMASVSNADQVFEIREGRILFLNLSC